MSEYQTISQIMQAAVSPVFLLAGVGALLNVLSGRLGRIIDRLRFLQRYIDITEGEDKAVMLMNRKQSIFRMRMMYISIFFCTLAGLMVCMVVAALFIGGINQFSLDSFISILFVACMICLIVSFVLLSLEIFLATKTTRRNLIKTETIVSKYKYQGSSNE